jgi:cytochrome c oxidase subunit 4
MLVTVFLSLLLLTAVTVAVAYVDLGEANLFVAMGIATVKAMLVALFFMHLAHDTGFNRLAFFGSFFFIALFVSFTLMDTGASQDDMDWQEHVVQQEAEAAQAPKAD